MKRKIDVEGQLAEGWEGVMYDPKQAMEEGLFDEITILRGSTALVFPHEVQPTTDLFDALMDQFEFGVNVGPDDEQTIYLAITYRYGYGEADPV